MAACGSLARMEVWYPLEEFYVVKARRLRSEKQDRAQAIGMVARAVKDARGARVGDLAYRSGRRSRQECWRKEPTRGLVAPCGSNSRTHSRRMKSTRALP